MSLESGYNASNESSVVNDVDGIADEQRAERPNLGKVPDQSAKNQQLFRTKMRPDDDNQRLLAPE